MKVKCFRASGFSYLEVLVAMVILAIAIVPAMQSIHTGILASGIQESLTQQHYALTKRMEELRTESYAQLLTAAKTAGNETTASSYSEPPGPERLLVFLALYDADVDPFTIIDPNNDADNDVYTGDTSDLLWVRVQLENTGLFVETLIDR